MTVSDQGGKLPAEVTSPAMYTSHKECGACGACVKNHTTMQNNRLVTYTCGGQMSKGHAYTLVTYTCGGQMSKGHAYTLVAYTCGGQMSK